MAQPATTLTEHDRLTHIEATMPHMATKADFARLEGKVATKEGLEEVKKTNREDIARVEKQIGEVKERVATIEGKMATKDDIADLNRWMMRLTLVMFGGFLSLASLFVASFRFFTPS